MKKLFTALVALVLSLSVSAQFYIYCSNGSVLKVDSIGDVLEVDSISLVKPDNSNNNEDNSNNQINNHEYVDLGLPSGLKWATCNVGATKPEEYGDYFAWGEVEPKEYYDYSTYKYGTAYNRLTKYCYDSDYGKDYLKARNFYKNIFKIFSNNFIALKHTAQLSNFICDFNTTKEVVTQDVLNFYKNDDFKYNILLNEKEIAEHKLYLESKPRTMLIAVTTKCNIKCLMCTRDKIWDIPEHVKNEIVTMFKYLEVVVWQGGEVFLYKHFFELLTLSKINEKNC